MFFFLVSANIFVNTILLFFYYTQKKAIVVFCSNIFLDVFGRGLVVFRFFFNIRLIIHLFTSSLNYGRWINLWKKINRPNFEGSSINLLNTLGWLIDYLTTYITLTTRIPWLSVIFVCSLSALFEKLSALLAGDFTSLVFLYALRYCEYRNKRKCLFSTILRSKQQKQKNRFFNNFDQQYRKKCM